MAHRTQLYLNDIQYDYLRFLARSERKSIAQVVRDWIDERQKRRTVKNYERDPFWKLRGLGSGGKSDVSRNFDDYLYGKRGS